LASSTNGKGDLRCFGPVRPDWQSRCPIGFGSTICLAVLGSVQNAPETNTADAINRSGMPNPTGLPGIRRSNVSIGEEMEKDP